MVTLKHLMTHMVDSDQKMTVEFIYNGDLLEEMTISGRCIALEEVLVDKVKEYEIVAFEAEDNILKVIVHRGVVAT